MPRRSRATQLLTVAVTLISCDGFTPDPVPLHDKLNGECNASFGVPDCVTRITDSALRDELTFFSFEVGTRRFIPDMETEQCLLNADCSKIQDCLVEPDQRLEKVYASCVGRCFVALRTCGDGAAMCDGPLVRECMHGYADCNELCGYEYQDRIENGSE